jgi:hypothetical protein
MSPQAQAIHDLLDHVDKLKAVHRASESPTFGQVEALFDHADLVRRAFALPERPTRAPWPTSHTQTEKAARRLVELVMASLTEAGAER